MACAAGKTLGKISKTPLESLRDCTFYLSHVSSTNMSEPDPFLGPSFGGQDGVRHMEIQLSQVPGSYSPVDANAHIVMVDKRDIPLRGKTWSIGWSDD